MTPIRVESSCNHRLLSRAAATVAAVAAATGVLVAPSTASAPAAPPDQTCTRYAAPWGRDDGRGTMKRPFRTAQRLVDSLRRGQTGCLRAGRYERANGHYVVDLRRSGLRIRSHPGERARLVGIVMIRQGADAATLSRLDFEGTGTMNTIKVHSADVVIEDSRITNRGRGLSCLMLGDNDGWGAAVRTVVRRNRFHDCGSAGNGTRDHAIYAANLVDGRIVGNVFWNSAAFAIHLYPNAQRTRVAFNVIDGGLPSVRGGVVISGDESYASSGNVVERNVVAFAQTANIEGWWAGPVGGDNIVRKNCVWAGKEANIRGSSITASDNLVSDPHFRHRETHDYRLAASSRCLSLLGRDPATLFRQ